MKKTVFDFQDYKAFLNEAIAAQPQNGHGFRGRIAEAVGCQRTYVSQVLHDKAHFNLEQAQKINQLLGHNDDESLFFLSLVELARAGTDELRRMIRKQLAKAINARMLVKSRVPNEHELTDEEKQRYHSAWYYAAVWVTTGIPGMNTRKALSERLNINSSKLGDVLDFLVGVGMLKQEGDRYEPTHHMVNLDSNSPLIAKHHTNWRVRAIQALDSEGPRDLHYSSVVSLSFDDALALRAQCVDFIERLQKKVRESPEETVCSFCLDFYEI